MGDTLSSLLSLITSNVPKQFFVASVFPSLTFLTLNLAFLYANASWFRRLEAFKFSVSATTLIDASVFTLLILAFSYALSSLNVALREILEGARLWPRALREERSAHYQAVRDALDGKQWRASSERIDLHKLRPKWIDRLRTATAAGMQQFATTFSYQKTTPAAVEVAALRTKRASLMKITSEELAAAVDALELVLSTNNMALAKAGAVPSLDADYRSLLGLVDYAIQERESRELDAFSRRQLQFGETDLAPTRMGNIAASVRSYARTRYEMNLDVLWGRLQAVAQANDRVADALVEAKTRLDFLVNSFWLVAASVATWLVAFALLGYSAVPVIAVALVGPFICWVLYSLGVASYLSLADVMRTSIDFYRFDLLRKLHVKLPSNTKQERILWRDLQRLAAYGDEDAFLIYDAQSQGATGGP